MSPRSLKGKCIMPRTKAKEESKSAIFRRLYETNLDLLKVPGYDELFRMYQAEDSSRKVGTSERQVAANVKSRLRSDHKIRGRRRGRRGRARMANGAVAPVMMTPQRVGAAHLALEDAIDDCIFLARRMDAVRFADVVRLLKRARNQLIVMTAK
jgi:hypothetical protein